MKIKEVEKAVGITKENIRYYEAEKLICPKRNSENNYRDYTQEDVVRLQRVIFLRSLGITIAEIKGIINESVVIADVLNRRIAEIEKENEKLKNIKSIAEDLAEEITEFNDIEVEYIQEKKSQLERERLYIVRKDTTKVELSKKGFVTAVTGLVAYGLLIGLLVIYLPPFQNHIPREIVLIYLICSFITMISLALTENVFILFVTFHLTVLTYGLAAVKLLISPYESFTRYMYIETPEPLNSLSLSVRIVTGYILCLVVYLVILRFVMIKSRKFYTSMIPTILLVTLASLLCAGVLFILGGKLIRDIVVSLVAIGYITVSIRIQTARVEKYTLYYAIQSSTNVLCILAFFHSLTSYYGPGNWRRGGHEFKNKKGENI